MDRCDGGHTVGWGWSVSHRSPLLVELVGALGEGWRAFVGTAERGETLVAPGVSTGLSGEPSRDLNWIVAYGPDGVAEGVSRAVRRLRERGLPGVVYAASPAAGEVAGVAGELDLKATGFLPVMCVRGGDVVRAEVGHEVRRVTNVEGVLSAGDVLGDAFDLPVDWCQRLLGVGFPTSSAADVYLSCHDGRPVAVAGVAQVGVIAGIYAVGTRHAHRRRGAGAAAMSAALDHHLGAGAQWFGLLSAPQAEPFYAGFGFVVVDHASVWTVEGA
jgi:GNAT superfamily N-acetyltransferase